MNLIEKSMAQSSSDAQEGSTAVDQSIVEAFIANEDNPFHNPAEQGNITDGINRPLDTTTRGGNRTVWRKGTANWNWPALRKSFCVTCRSRQ